MQSEDIVVYPDEVKALGEKVLIVLFDNMPDPMRVKDLLLAIETLKTISEMLKNQMEKEGVKINFRREEWPT